MKSKRSKACDIPDVVRARVGERDNYTCIICGKQGIPNAHYIPRSLGGLGVEENIVCLCSMCHYEYDNGSKRKEHGKTIESYLRSQYPYWNRGDCIYSKYDW